MWRLREHLILGHGEVFGLQQHLCQLPGPSQHPKLALGQCCPEVTDQMISAGGPGVVGILPCFPGNG